jgi:hypothetical protein
MFGELRELFSKARAHVNRALQPDNHDIASIGQFADSGLQEWSPCSPTTERLEWKSASSSFTSAA